MSHTTDLWTQHQVCNTTHRVCSLWRMDWGWRKRWAWIK